MKPFPALAPFDIFKSVVTFFEEGHKALPCTQYNMSVVRYLISSEVCQGRHGYHLSRHHD